MKLCSRSSSERGPGLRSFSEGGCWARYLCGGGCPQNRVEIGGSVDAQMPYVCAAKKAMMREVFWIAAQLTREEAMKAAGIDRAK